MKNKGFTIIELVVGAFLLTLLLTMSTPLLYQLIRYQTQSNNADNLNDNLQYKLMILEKELATGRNIKNIVGGGIEFIDQYNVVRTYRPSDFSPISVESLKIVGQANDKRHIVSVFILAKSSDGKTQLPIQMSIIPRNQDLNN